MRGFSLVSVPGWFRNWSLCSGGETGNHTGEGARLVFSETISVSVDVVKLLLNVSIHCRIPAELPQGQSCIGVAAVQEG